MKTQYNRKYFLPDIKLASRLLVEINNQKPSRRPRIVDKSLVLYGAGDLGRMAAAYFKFLGIEVNCVVDKDALNHSKNEFWKDYKVIPPSEVPADLKEQALLAICVVNLPYSTLEFEVKKHGWKDIVPFYDISEAYKDRHPLSNGWFMSKLKNDQLKKVKLVLSSFADNASRAHHLQFLAWHYLRVDYFFKEAPVNTKNRYFIPQIQSLLCKEDIYLDVGAHFGEVIIKFKKLLGSFFKKTFAIEADKKSFKLLLSNLQFEGFKEENVLVMNEIVGQKGESCKYFDGIGYSSQKSSIGYRTGTSRSIDDLNLGPVSIIKVHVEGWELDVLKGALATIKCFRPILMVTTYHNFQGVWETPAWMIKNLDNYLFYERMHSWCGTGLVMYCIPKEKSWSK